MLTVRPAAPLDGHGIHGLLSAAALPVADLESSQVDFLVADADGALVGAVGLETAGTDGLLRSLVVSPRARAMGTGSALVEAIERRASQLGLSRMVLLTQTATVFFTKRGYAPANRATMPDALQATAEFRSLCPSSATCLAKDLGQP